jgi:hypothetical protein
MKARQGELKHSTDRALLSSFRLALKPETAIRVAMLGLPFPLIDAGQVGASVGAFTAEIGLRRWKINIVSAFGAARSWGLLPFIPGQGAVEFVLARINIALASGSVTIGLRGS